MTDVRTQSFQYDTMFVYLYSNDYGFLKSDNFEICVDSTVQLISKFENTKWYDGQISKNYICYSTRQILG